MLLLLHPGQKRPDRRRDSRNSILEVCLGGFRAPCLLAIDRRLVAPRSIAAPVQVIQVPQAVAFQRQRRSGRLTRLGVVSVRDKPAGCNYGLPSVDYGLLWRIVAYDFGLRSTYCAV